MAEVPPRLRTPLASLVNVRTHAILDAPPAEGPEKLPVLVFSHGFGGSPSAYTALLEDLASHGYAVLSIVHPYEAAAATLADGQVISLFDEAGKPRPAFRNVITEWEREDETMAAVTKEATEEGQLRLLRGYLAGLRATNATLERWVADTKLVLDRLSELPKTSVAGRLASRLDLGRLGALGHSMGGVTSGQFCLEDRRCRAGLNLDGIPQYGTMIDQRLSGSISDGVLGPAGADRGERCHLSARRHAVRSRGRPEHAAPRLQRHDPLGRAAPRGRARNAGAGASGGDHPHDRPAVLRPGAAGKALAAAGGKETFPEVTVRSFSRPAPK